MAWTPVIIKISDGSSVLNVDVRSTALRIIGGALEIRNAIEKERNLIMEAGLTNNQREHLRSLREDRR